MATLAESFLADLEDLSDGEPVADEGDDGSGAGEEGMEEDGVRCGCACACRTALHMLRPEGGKALRPGRPTL